jgi:hypothetical protein
MTKQDNMVLSQSLFDLYNKLHSDPEWLDKSRAADSIGEYTQWH